MFTKARRITAIVFFSVLVLVSTVIADAVRASGSYTYDNLGRLVTALYDNGSCMVYAYDPNGNRTSQTITLSGSPETPTWGTGTWGCFNWTP